MNPRRLIAILERADPSFQELFYPKALRCPLDGRIVRAMEEHWPAYFPTHKQCRGSSWSLTIPENKALYKPHPNSRQKLEQWKRDIQGTIVEMRAHKADISWKRFVVICRKIPRLRPLLKEFKPLADFLIDEESMWPRYGGILVGQEGYLQGQMRALFSAGSPYRHADPGRLGCLCSSKSANQKIRIIQLMRSLFDRPLMTLAIIQKCASESEHSQFWLPIQHQIAAIVKTQSPTTFRRTWLEHAMQVSGAIKKTGKSCPRKWAKKLIFDKTPDLDAINTKAIEVNGWLKGNKQPSLGNIRLAGQVIFNSDKLNSERIEVWKDLWLFCWMLTVWLEKHYREVAAELKGNNRKIRRYYLRFFHYLKIDRLAGSSKEAGGTLRASLDAD